MSFRATAGISPLSLLPAVVRGAPPSPVFARTGEGVLAIRSCSLPCVQGRVGVGLHELAASFEFNARLLHPTLTLPYYT